MAGLRPHPTPIYHFTHVDHLASIVEQGLLSDTLAQTSGQLAVEIGNTSIKAQRRIRTVPVGPRGVVADYVPFYYAPRSPMMYSIHMNNVPTYQGGCGELVYLVTTVERLFELDLDLVFTDRNAVLSYRASTTKAEELDDMVDWDLMKAKYWNNTKEFPDRIERRMAECLVHQKVPWEAFYDVVTASTAPKSRAEAILGQISSTTQVRVGPDWYF